LAPFWFLAGVLFTLSSIVLLWPWLRRIPSLGSPPALPWQAGVGAVLTLAAVLASGLWLGIAPPAVDSRPVIATQSGGQAAAAPDNTADSWAGIADALRSSAGGNTPGPGSKPGAEPMIAAIASLQARLAKSGGTADDWELLAKSYEFLGRAAEARKARAHQLPPLPSDGGAGSVTAAASPQATSAGSNAVLSGEVSLAPALKAQAAAGTTLFIVAKSVDSPGAPVAVFRTTVGSWPVKFDLSDSQSMLPGRNLSNAGRVTVEARISQSGQALPAAGDLQGSTGVINPADHPALQILIDRVVK
jgi:cytochrome c-type biogenesis protein CcmH